MSSSLNYKALESWCQDAITILAATGVPDKIADMQRKAVTHNSNSSILYEIADSLAEGLDSLPDEARKSAQQKLILRYGFGFDFFVEKKMKKIKSILKKGRIKNESEFRDVLEFANDTSHSQVLLNAAEILLAQWKDR